MSWAEDFLLELDPDSAAVRRLRAMRREEATLRLEDQGWSRAAAEAWVLERDGPVGPYLDSQDPRMTPRVAKGGQLAHRLSGRRRRRAPGRSRPDWWSYGA